MKNIKNWEKFNESHKVELFDEILSKLDGVSDVVSGDAIGPYLNFVYNNLPFSISLTDKLGSEYRTVVIIVEVDGITDTLGSFDINEVEKIVDVIKGVKK